MDFMTVMIKGVKMNNLYDMRKEKGWSLEEVALACTPQTTAKQISRLEKGERKLTTQWAERLAIVFDVSPVQILYGESADMGTSEKTPLELAKALEKTIASDDDLRPIMESFVKVLEERAKK